MCCLRTSRHNNRQRQSTQIITHQNGNSVIERLMTSNSNVVSQCNKEPSSSNVIIATVTEQPLIDSEIKWVRITFYQKKM
uniref:Uncharacterized protein n=1 Tax=Panagrolaimus sp. JU765 TaxID=591449 RepID=A0AC34RT51_9BILA